MLRFLTRGRDKKLLIKQLSKDILDESFACGEALNDFAEGYARTNKGCITQEAIYFFLHCLHRATHRGKDSKKLQTELFDTVANEVFETVEALLERTSNRTEKGIADSMGQEFYEREGEYCKVSLFGESHHDPRSAFHLTVARIGHANGVSNDALFEALISKALILGFSNLQLTEKVKKMETLLND